MNIHKIIETTKEMMSQQLTIEYKSKIHRIPYKNTSSITGLIAFGLIIDGSVEIQIHPIFGIMRIVYAFGVMLPISYFQMRKSEEAKE